DRSVLERRRGQLSPRGRSAGESSDCDLFTRHQKIAESVIIRLQQREESSRISSVLYALDHGLAQQLGSKWMLRGRLHDHRAPFAKRLDQIRPHDANSPGKIRGWEVHGDASRDAQRTNIDRAIERDGDRGKAAFALAGGFGMKTKLKRRTSGFTIGTR